MAELKTRPNDSDVYAFVAAVEQPWKREDSLQLIALFSKITGAPPVMWGDSIIGFGNYHFKYESGKELDWFFIGFSPRKASLSLYLMGRNDEINALLADLGKHKTSVGCVYIKRLSEINMNILEQIAKKSMEVIKQRYAAYN